MGMHLCGICNSEPCRCVVGRGTTTLDYLRARHPWLGDFIDSLEEERDSLRFQLEIQRTSARVMSDALENTIDYALTLIPDGWVVHGISQTEKLLSPPLPGTIWLVVLKRCRDGVKTRASAERDVALAVRTAAESAKSIDAGPDTRKPPAAD